ATDMAVTEHDPFLAGQALEADRAAGVDAVGGNADLGAEAILEAVSKPRRGIDHHRAGIDLGEETSRPRPVLGDDALGVAGAVLADVVHGVVDIGDDFYRQDRRQVFLAPVVLAGDL